MFWKNAKLSRLQSWSLVNKLTLSYSIATISILLAVFLYLYPPFYELINSTYADYQTHFQAAKQIKKVCFDRLLVTVLLSAAGSLFLGHFIAKNALGRIRDLTKKMENISAHSLKERINPEDWPKELKMLGVNFNNMLDRIQYSFEQLSQFSADIAHELRNPIHMLRGSTEVMLSHPKSIEEYQSLLCSHMEEYEYLTRLIENLLFLARSDHKKISLIKQNFNAKDEILKITEFYQAALEEKEISVSYEGAGFVLADKVLFRRVISNLLSNAIRYTDKQGKVHICMKKQDGFFQISVSDTGIGLEQEHLAKIFDRFYRADSSRARHSGGVGLGLAIVKSVIDLHQGHVLMKSEKHCGTTVYLNFPY